jgi:predicted molibdopterin-dependent oxidoreductase YjgC
MKEISFFFNGSKVTATDGQSIAAALLAHDIRTLRKTRFGNSERSLFCGIGVCFDCVVIVDGVANQRSCLITVRDGMKVESNS